MKNVVSIIVPVYNAEKYLSRCIDCLLKQTYTKTEIILINDGSMDNSLEICQKYQRMYEKIKVINQKNQGVSCARNAGIDKATGDYICFVDADDCIEKNFVEELITGLDNGSDMAICGHDKVYSGKVVKRIPKYNATWDAQQLRYRLFLDTTFMVVIDKIYKNEILQQYHIRFVENLRMSEDTLFEMEYALHCEKATYIPNALYHYMQNDESVTHTVNMVKLKTERLKFWDCYLELESKIDGTDTAAKDAYCLRKFYEAMGIVQLYEKEEVKEKIPKTVLNCYKIDALHFVGSSYVRLRFKLKYLALKMGVLHFFQ